MFPVHDTWDAKGWVLDLVCWEWLIERIKSDDVRVASESSRSSIPVGHELVVQVLLVGEKTAKAGHALLGVVVVCEHHLEALVNQEVTIIISVVPVIIHVVTLANAVVVILEDDIRNWINA